MSLTQLPASADRDQIRDVLATYAFGLDRRDFSAVASVFTDAAHVENIFEEYLAEAETFRSTTVGGHAVAAGAEKLFEKLDATQHFLGAQTIEVELESGGAHVRASTQIIAHHHRSGDYYHTGGTYEDDLVRGPSGWRIERRVLRIAWTTGTPAVFS